MKNNNKKIVSILTLSLLAVVALASCGGNSGGGTDKPGFHVFAISTDGDLNDSDCLTATATSEIKYKKDLVIDIKPNQYFSMRKNDKPIIPYVGLGNSITKYDFPLHKDVMWTYEDKSTAEKGEEYVLTVKGEYFVKNVVISYGDRVGETHYDEVQCEYNEYYLYKDPEYKREIISPVNLTPLPIGCLEGTPDHPAVTDIFYTDPSKCKCSFARTFVTFAFKANEDCAGPILDFAAYTATKPATGGKAPREYSYIDVIGVYDNQTEEKLDYASDKEGEFRIRVEDNVIYVDIPWKDVITEGAHEYGYTHKFERIDFKFDPVYIGHKEKDDEKDIPYGIKTTFDPTIKDYRAGYLTEDVEKNTFHIYEDNTGRDSEFSNKKVWQHSLFKQSGMTRFDYTQLGTHDETLFGTRREYGYDESTQKGTETVGHIGQLADASLTSSERGVIGRYVHPGFEQNAIDIDALSGKYKYDVSAYSANFLWNQSPEGGTKWPDVQIKVSNAVGQETTTLKWEEPKQTDWRNKYYSKQGSQLTGEELWYKETDDHNWRLVCLNRNPARQIGVGTFEIDGVDPSLNLMGKNNAYLLYSLKGAESFNEVAFVNIDIGPAK